MKHHHSLIFLTLVALATPAAADPLGPVSVDAVGLIHQGRYDSVNQRALHDGFGSYANAFADGRITNSTSAQVGALDDGVSFQWSFAQSIEQRTWSYDDRQLRFALTAGFLSFSLEEAMSFELSSAFSGNTLSTFAATALIGPAGGVYSEFAYGGYNSGDDVRRGSASGILGPGRYTLAFARTLKDPSTYEWCSAHAEGSLQLNLYGIPQRPEPELPQPPLELEPEQPTIQPVPEPGTWALLALAGLGLLLRRKP